MCLHVEYGICRKGSIVCDGNPTGRQEDGANMNRVRTRRLGTFREFQNMLQQNVADNLITYAVKYFVCLHI